MATHPDMLMLEVQARIFNAVEHAMSLPPRQAVTPLPIRFVEDEPERSCSYCGATIVNSEEDTFCSDECSAAYCRWIDGEESEGPHGREE